MYGDVKKAGECSLKVTFSFLIVLKVLEFGIPIPYEQVNDEEYMKKLRSLFRFNPDMPGAIEHVHPNKFLPSKQF